MIVAIISSLVFFYLLFSLVKRARELGINTLWAIIEIILIQSVIISIGIGVVYLIAKLVAMAIGENIVNMLYINLSCICVYAADYFGTKYCAEEILFPRQKSDKKEMLRTNPSNEVIESESITIIRNKSEIEYLEFRLQIENCIRTIVFSRCKYIDGYIYGFSKNERIELMISTSRIEYRYLSRKALIKTGWESVGI